MKKDFIEEISDSELNLFNKKLRKLSSFKGSGTELISLYVPYGADRSAIMSQLINEKSQSSNIKDPNTRKNVQGALKRIINLLKQINFDIPKNGLAVFCGNISKQEGKSDIRLFTVVPIRKLETKMYWCDSEFNLEPLKQMVLPTEIYGIIAIDKNEATIAILKGKAHEIIGHFNSNVAGKQRAGGQSAKRFEHLREEAEHNFYKKVSEAVNGALVPYAEKLNGIIVAGPGFTKETFLEKDFLDYRLKNKIIGTVSTSYTDEYGIKEAIERGKELLKNAAVVKEKEAVSEFMTNIIKTGLAVYGEKETLEALESGKVAKLLISERINKTAYKLQCTHCGFEKTITIEESESPDLKCEKCGYEMEILEENDYVELLMKKAEKMGTKTIIISTETDEGEQFWKTFGGLGGILRYR
ncbi:MAG: peptide chain release factor aRF-1 [Candidatus Diapherotrites archaeon]